LGDIAVEDKVVVDVSLKNIGKSLIEGYLPRITRIKSDKKIELKHKT